VGDRAKLTGLVGVVNVGDDSTDAAG
jgi:hypothetical protein